MTKTDLGDSIGEFDASLSEEDMAMEALDQDLVKPSGYQLLVVLYREPEKTSGGIFKPDSLIDRETTASICGLVLAIGSDAYVDTPARKWPSGPLCKKGDFIMFRSYTGTRFRIRGGGSTEFRLIPDDAVDAVVSDPTRITRA